MFSEMSDRPEYSVNRVRHPLKLRVGQVTKVVSISPELVRITLAGDDFRDFNSMSFDDHVKVFFPIPGAEKPVLPHVNPDGSTGFPEGSRPIARDFTPRRFDRHTGELDLEFVLHGAGPATTWAAQAQSGQYLGIGGPRGSLIIPASFDWHVFIGDETALPAIGRRLEELPSSTRALVVAEVSNSSSRIRFDSRASLEVTWCERGGPSSKSLLAAVRALPEFPAGEGYAWAAAESAVARQLRLHLAGERGLVKSRIRAAAYWKRGLEAVHEVIED